MKLPINDQWTLYDNAASVFRMLIATSVDTDDWAWQGYVYDKSEPATSVVDLVISFDSATGVMQATYDPADVAAALDTEASLDLQAVIMADTGGANPEPFADLSVVLKKGGPAWAA